MSSDRLASPTLAQLYLAQGHDGHAKRVLDAVLQREPFHGHALVLRARLRARVRARIEVSFDAQHDELLVRWQQTTSKTNMVVVHVWYEREAGVEHSERTAACTGVRGELRIPVLPHGSCCACIASIPPRENDAAMPGPVPTLHPIAVADPVSW